MNGAEWFDRLDGIPCAHGQVNGWHCFECAIASVDALLKAECSAARADGYRAGIEAAAKVAVSFGQTREVYNAMDIADDIRALAARESK